MELNKIQNCSAIDIPFVSQIRQAYTHENIVATYLLCRGFVIFYLISLFTIFLNIFFQQK